MEGDTFVLEDFQPDLEYSRTVLQVNTPSGDAASLRSGSDDGIGTSSTTSENAQKKRVIIDKSEMDKMFNFETEDDETDLESCASAAFSRQTSRDDVLDDEIAEREDTAKKLARVARDLAIYGDAPPSTSSCVSPTGASGGGKTATSSTGSGIRRRNSITVCETPKRKHSGDVIAIRKDSASSSTSSSTTRRKKKVTKKKKSKDVSHRYSHHDSLLHPLPKKTIPLTADTSSDSDLTSRSTTPVMSTDGELSSGRATPTMPGASSERMMMESLHSEFMQSKQWADALNTLDLSLDEVVHIRSVLTKAELESLPLDGSVKDDVEKGKICFLCMKTRFGFFTWGVRCQLCKQQVCSKCSSKMRIPLEHFTTFPAAALSRATNDEESRRRKVSTTTTANTERRKEKKRRSFLSFRNSAGSAPTSPETVRKNSAIQLTASQAQSSSLVGLNLSPADLEYDHSGNSSGSGIDETTQGPGPVSLPANLAKKAQPKKKASRQEELFGSLLQVCADCKDMILQVIRAQTTARRFQMTKNMFSAAVNPSPSYRNEEVY